MKWLNGDSKQWRDHIDRKTENYILSKKKFPKGMGAVRIAAADGFSDGYTEGVLEGFQLAIDRFQSHLDSPPPAFNSAEQRERKFDGDKIEKEEKEGDNGKDHGPGAEGRIRC